MMGDPLKASIGADIDVVYWQIERKICKYIYIYFDA